MANNTDVRRNGIRIESSTIRLRTQVIGITANNMAATKATLLPYRRPAMLYNRRVSTTASIPINTLGIAYSISKELLFVTSKSAESGNWIIENNAARKI
jgi:hypothetical protein